ncbi:MAG: GNAT family N-acetyltransferase, partial [Bacteroidales bacterium]|nr:GNAT family N-acetyltransferase [Bacteroidales bacterium]
ELAEYERLSHEVTATEEILRNSLFGSRKSAEVVFALVDGVEAGFALWFHNFSTFVGKPGLYLEDLYVKPEFRKKGIGKALMEYCIGVATERDCGRMEWWVLKWNPAIRFYEMMGAEPMDEWVVYRLTADKLRSIASKSGTLPD